MTNSTLRLAVAAAGLTLAATTGSLVGVAAAQADPTPPAPDTIVRVTGDAQTGFGIKYYDGSSDFPPRLREALDDCADYPARIGQARCRTKVKTWYRDLADTKQALKWARSAA
ncbi:hypothetical protein [Nocardioides sp. P86]|uniref:hypothetical protein n=1 Tax=Nocardioides sp. P86 TaxID=2939569 RepID=UPI00203ECA4B|nr:hypothetical protein [Nocardioides sp. P86]MCM3514662.1 hypothetical protein [Nocardioides sp. P86]